MRHAPALYGYVGTRDLNKGLCGEIEMRHLPRINKFKRYGRFKVGG